MAVIQAPRSSGGGIGDTLSSLAQIATMVIPGAQVAAPYVAAMNTARNAANGNWAGAGISALGMINGGHGFNTNFNKNLTANFANKALQQPVNTGYGALDKVYNGMKGTNGLSGLATGGSNNGLIPAIGLLAPYVDKLGGFTGLAGSLFYSPQKSQVLNNDKEMLDGAKKLGQYKIGRSEF